MEYIPAKTIVTRTKGSSWFGVDHNMNIYRGCNHGCIYCDSRSSCYHVFDFENVKAKENALEIIRNDLRRKVKPGVVSTGSMSDPYNPFEKKYQLTRNSLELLSAYQFGVAIATKSPLVTRDIDILKEISDQSPTIVKLTITTPHDDIARKIEPHVAPTSERLEALAQLSANGIFCGVLLMPILPWITDNPKDIQLLVEKIAKTGARFIYASFGMTIRDGQREYFYSMLDKEYPGLRERYQKTYGARYSCTVSDPRTLWNIFKAECDKYGLLYSMKDIISVYKTGYESNQLKFF